MLRRGVAGRTGVRRVVGHDQIVRRAGRKNKTKPKLDKWEGQGLGWAVDAEMMEREQASGREKMQPERSGGESTRDWVQPIRGLTLHVRTLVLIEQSVCLLHCQHRPPRYPKPAGLH